jgi:F-type H+-transporting ATPase subunit gamma
MEQLARIEARLNSLQELDELVGALRSMAASRAREAQEAFEGTRAYTAIVERAIAEVAPLAAPRSGRAEGRSPEDGRVLLVITSENGFVGGFNNRLIDHALGARETGEPLAIVGRRGQIAATERHVAPDLTFPMTSRAQGVTALARRIAARLSDATTVRVVFARYRSGASFDLETRQVLPLGAVSTPGAAALPPLHHLPPDVLLAELGSEYLFAEIAHALMESLASENGARLRTMDAATHNIDDKLEKLRRDERVARQAQTTSDMLDVVTGAEAVNHH